MFGSIQWGLFAACVVLFVPMAMAGWHLSRNKMLFFSGALFITLAVGVHLTPYFPSFVDFVDSMHSVAIDSQEDSCLGFVNDVVWDVQPLNTNKNETYISWDFPETGSSSSCGFSKLQPQDAADLLNGSWVAVAGDSQARLLVQALLTLLLNDSEALKTDLFKRHSDYEHVIEETNTKLSFLWAPYVSNLTDLVIEYKNKRSYPDMLIMGASLWDMLHITDAKGYKSSLQKLRNSVESLLPFFPQVDSDGPMKGSVSIKAPHLFWLGTPFLITEKLNTEEKKVKMSSERLQLYDKALESSGLLRENGGFLMHLKLESLSLKCGLLCTVDGMHYNDAVYDAAVHVLLNSLLIESHQKLETT